MSTTKSRSLPKGIKNQRKGSETELVTATLNILQWFVQDGMFWRNNSGMIATQSGTMVKLAPAGTADIIGLIMPMGLFVALEAKVPHRRNNVSDNQKKWLRQVELIGGYAGVFCTTEEALQHIQKARQLQVDRMSRLNRPLDSGSLE